MLILPILTQGLLMIVDEFICHRQRVLPRWERVGHPIDTFSYLVCVIAAALHVSQPLFFALAALSCFVVSKDELIHFEVCGRFEMWLHSLLFVLHPICLYCVWRMQDQPQAIGLVIIATIFMLTHQILYWNVLWRTLKR